MDAVVTRYTYESHELSDLQAQFKDSDKNPTLASMLVEKVHSVRALFSTLVKLRYDELDSIQASVQCVPATPVVVVSKPVEPVTIYIYEVEPSRTPSGVGCLLYCGTYMRLMNDRNACYLAAINSCLDTLGALEGKKITFCVNNIASFNASVDFTQSQSDTLLMLLARLAVSEGWVVQEYTDGIRNIPSLMGGLRCAIANFPGLRSVALCEVPAVYIYVAPLYLFRLGEDVFLFVGQTCHQVDTMQFEFLRLSYLSAMLKETEIAMLTHQAIVFRSQKAPAMLDILLCSYDDSTELKAVQSKLYAALNSMSAWDIITDDLPMSAYPMTFDAFRKWRNTSLTDEQKSLLAKLDSERKP